VGAFGDKDENIRMSACETLGKMGGKATTSEVISNSCSYNIQATRYAPCNLCFHD
jgi:hypothetical protein